MSGLSKFCGFGRWAEDVAVDEAWFIGQIFPENCLIGKEGESHKQGMPKCVQSSSSMAMVFVISKRYAATLLRCSEKAEEMAGSALISNQEQKQNIKQKHKWPN